jgi:hypothetical protein
MNYSLLHQHLAYNLSRIHNINKQDVLENPEKYFGPNYRELLNFWFYKETLSDEQLVVCGKRYWESNSQTTVEAKDLAIKLASEVIGSEIPYDIGYTECEIIAAHLYIEQGIPFTFLPLIFDL